MRHSPFFQHCETVQISHFSPKFFYSSPINFLIFCNRMDVQKITKGPPFYIFRHYATYRRLQKKFEKKFRKFFSSIFSFLRASVVSSCRKSGFRVLLSLRYGADLGRSRLVQVNSTVQSGFLLKFLRQNKINN